MQKLREAIVKHLKENLPDYEVDPSPDPLKMEHMFDVNYDGESVGIRLNKKSVWVIKKITTMGGNRIKYDDSFGPMSQVAGDMPSVSLVPVGIYEYAKPTMLQEMVDKIKEVLGEKTGPEIRLS